MVWVIYGFCILFKVRLDGWLIVLFFSLFLYAFCFNVRDCVFTYGCVCSCCFRLFWLFDGLFVVCCSGVVHWFVGV